MRTHFPWMGIALTLACCFATASHADDRDFSGTVTHIFDGDSFIVLPTGVEANRENEIEVRLMDIDAPEKDQPHADHARDALIQLIDGRRVFVDVVDIDKYERKVATVRREPDSLDIARALVHDGHVWVNRKYAKDKTLAALEDTARSNRAGLWSLPHSELVPPWRFREESNGRKNAQKTQKGQTRK